MSVQNIKTVTPFSPPTVALVDDNELFLDEMSRLLMAMGFKVLLRAVNGQDFLSQMATTLVIPDLCLLDVDMPVMNGVTTASCMRQIWPHIKILAYTFNSCETGAMMASGADACLLKGGSAKELKNMLMDLYASGRSLAAIS